jgi:AcrR family transcriptional regulator
MASRRRTADREPAVAAIDALADAGPAEVVRRAPFADNPQVGARGQRTQQRILDAALEAFAEGYERCSIDAIARRAGCSRAAFYQYFSSKEDVFRHLSGQVARALSASNDALEPVRPDAEGWRALRAWIARHSEIYERYEPVFHAYQAASESDQAVAAGSARWRLRSVAKLGARIAGERLRGRSLDAVLGLLLECVTRTQDMASILRSAAPGHYGEPRLGDALTDVVHRALFGRRDDVNVHRPRGPRPPVLRFDRAIRAAFTGGERLAERSEPGRATWEALCDAGRKALVERGYHRTRVGDVVAAAGVSRGVFYRYFRDKDELARTLATGAVRTVAAVFAEIPSPDTVRDAAGRAALRRWLRRYNVAQANEAAMLRVWVDAALQDAPLRASTAPAIDWGRRVLVSFLEPRGFGDVEYEALVLVAFLSCFGARERTPAELDAAAHVVEQGLLGLERA